MRIDRAVLRRRPRGRNAQLRTSLVILYELAESRRGRTWYQLAARAGVATRTVRRHIAAMQDAGFAVDVYTPQDLGHHGDQRSVVTLVNPGFASRVLSKRVAL